MCPREESLRNMGRVMCLYLVVLKIVSETEGATSYVTRAKGVSTWPELCQRGVRVARRAVPGVAHIV